MEVQEEVDGEEERRRRSKTTKNKAETKHRNK